MQSLKHRKVPYSKGPIVTLQTLPINSPQAVNREPPKVKDIRLSNAVVLIKRYVIIPNKEHHSPQTPSLNAKNPTKNLPNPMMKRESLEGFSIERKYSVEGDLCLRP